MHIWCCRFGYVDVTPEDLEKAMEVNGKELNGEPIRIDRSKPKAAPEADARVQGGMCKCVSKGKNKSHFFPYVYILNSQ